MVNYDSWKLSSDEVIPELTDMVSGFTWQEAAKDLWAQLEKVETPHLQYLLERLEAGQVEGRRDGLFAIDQEDVRDGHFVPVDIPPCGCFVATIGSQIEVADEKLPNYYLSEEWAKFEFKYDTIAVCTPFQKWLFAVWPTDTPQNNPVAAAFAEELRKMIADRKG